MAELLDHPGLSIMDLARQFNVGRSTIRHHLYILERQGAVRRRQVGKIPTFSLAAGTTSFALESVQADDAFAALQHPIRGELWQAACRTTLEPASASSAGMKLPETTIRRNCEILERLGILERISGLPRTAWIARVFPETFLSHYASLSAQP